MKLPFQIPLSALFLAVVACTDYREEEMPVSFGVDVSQVDFSSATSSRSVTVTSGTMWDVTVMPEWISLKSIKSSIQSPFEWIVDFNAVANEEYDREGLIIIKSGSEAEEIVVTQEGKKGKYIAVESVSLSSTELNLTVGESATLAHTIRPENASVKEVSWKSSAPSVATISQTGRVDAVAEGTASITVTTEDGNKTAICQVTVKPVSVSSVSLDRETLSLKIGETSALVATVLPDNAANKKVSWSSSNTGVATVDSNGDVSAIKVGTSVITATTEDGGKTATCILTVDPVSVTGVNLNKSSLTLLVGDSETLTATVAPSNATNKRVSWSSSNTSVVTVDSNGKVNAVSGGTATITATTEDGGKTASCSVTVNVPDGSENGYEYVVLGLPSGLKWATCNVGAYKPEEYGNFYAWGETQSKTYYSGGTYKWWNWNGVTYKLTKYCPADQTSCWDGEGTPDGKTVLDLEDDTAHVNLGGHWRMPTDEEWVELMENCTWTWTIQNGIAGRLVSANNGKSIFLPAAGLQDHRGLINVGSYGLYWSSSLATDDPDQAWFMYFGSDIVYWDRMSRYYGYSIRPVLD